MIALRQDRDPDKPFVEAFARAGQKAYAKRLRELEAGKATAPRYDPLTALERREEARAQRHMGSVVRRLHKVGIATETAGVKTVRRLSQRQLNALEVWASDWSASQVGARSQLGRDDAAGGGSTELVDTSSELAWTRYQRARKALLERAGRAVEMIAHRVAVQNMSLTAAVADAIGRQCLDAGEAFDLVAVGGDVLDAHYRRSPA